MGNRTSTKLTPEDIQRAQAAAQVEAKQIVNEGVRQSQAVKNDAVRESQAVKKTEEVKEVKEKEEATDEDLLTPSKRFAAEKEKEKNDQEKEKETTSGNEVDVVNPEIEGMKKKKKHRSRHRSTTSQAPGQEGDHKSRHRSNAPGSHASHRRHRSKAPSSENIGNMKDMDALLQPTEKKVEVAEVKEKLVEMEIPKEEPPKVEEPVHVEAPKQRRMSAKIASVLSFKKDKSDAHGSQPKKASLGNRLSQVLMLSKSTKEDEPQKLESTNPRHSSEENRTSAEAMNQLLAPVRERSESASSAIAKAGMRLSQRLGSLRNSTSRSSKGNDLEAMAEAARNSEASEPHKEGITSRLSRKLSNMRQSFSGMFSFDDKDDDDHPKRRSSDIRDASPTASRYDGTDDFLQDTRETSEKKVVVDKRMSTTLLDTLEKEADEAVKEETVKKRGRNGGVEVPSILMSKEESEATQKKIAEMTKQIEGGAKMAELDISAINETVESKVKSRRKVKRKKSERINKAQMEEVNRSAEAIESPTTPVSSTKKRVRRKSKNRNSTTKAGINQVDLAEEKAKQIESSPHQKKTRSSTTKAGINQASLLEEKSKMQTESKETRKKSRSSTTKQGVNQVALAEEKNKHEHRKHSRGSTTKQGVNKSDLKEEEKKLQQETFSTAPPSPYATKKKETTAVTTTTTNEAPKSPYAAMKAKQKQKIELISPSKIDMHKSDSSPKADVRKIDGLKKNDTEDNRNTLFRIFDSMKGKNQMEEITRQIDEETKKAEMKNVDVLLSPSPKAAKIAEAERRLDQLDY